MWPLEQKSMDIYLEVVRDTLKIEDYQNDKGQSLYIFYLKFHKPLGSEVDRNGWQNLVTNRVDVSKKDPFVVVMKKYKDGDITIKTCIVQEMWDIIMKNKDRWNGKDKVLSYEVIAKFEKHWEQLNQHEMRTYLYKFCIAVGPDINYMEGIKGIDIAKVYNKIQPAMIDVFKFDESNTKNDSGCFIM